MTGPSATGWVSLAELTDDPHPVLARLRSEAPVAWVPALDGWLVTGHAVAAQVLRDSATFTVADPRFSTARVIGPSMLSLDGDQHRRHRGPFGPAFRPGAVHERFTGLIGAEVDRLLGGLAGAGGADVRADVAGPLAVRVMAVALGLDGAAVADARRWYAALVDGVEQVSAGRAVPAAADAALAELRRHVAEHLAPGSLLTRAAEQLEHGDLVANAAVLMFGGIDTTEGMITNAALQLLLRPAVLATVRSDPDRLADAVEESLRLEPAAARLDRYATRAVSLGGVTVSAGDLVVVSAAGANQDPAVFAQPDRFVLGRTDVGAHLAFAVGPHFCIGAHLARLQAQTALAALLDRFPRLRLAPGPPPRPQGLIFRRPPALPVRWD